MRDAATRYEPPYQAEEGEFSCENCGSEEAALMQHPDDENTLVCVVCGTRYDTPKEGPWPLTAD